MATEPVADEKINKTEDHLKMWPSRDSYLFGIAEADRVNRVGLEKQLLEKGYQEDQIPDIASVILRGQYTYNFLNNITSFQNKVDTNIVWNTGLNRNTRANAGMHMSYAGQDVDSYDSAISLLKDGKSLDLKSVDINVNLNEVVRAVKQAHRYYSLYLESHPGDFQGAEEMKKEMVDEASIKTELAVVEEVAHTLFFASIFKTNNRLLEWLEENKDYKSHIPGKEDSILVMLSDDEQRFLDEKYTNKRVEVKAEVLVNLFKKKYYPNFQG